MTRTPDFIARETLDRELDWGRLIHAIEFELKQNRIIVPERHNHTITLPTGSGGSSGASAATANLLLMPAWISGKAIGVKLVSFFPGNREQGLPTIHATYILMNGETGAVQAVIDGDALTERRTAAASALAARHLARTDSRTLLVVGTGQLSVSVAEAHAHGRALQRIMIFGRSPDKAARVVDVLRKKGLPAEICKDVESGCRASDIISCVTSSTTPIVFGEWLRPGIHLDLIGSFSPALRESDDEAVRRARIFVDTRTGAMQSGDLCHPLANGSLRETDILGELADLVREPARGRLERSDITLFKSAGFALEDMAAALLAAGND